MIYRIVCPIQQTETFSLDVCRSCKSFDLTKGKHLTARCRKNRSPVHKRDFEGAFFSNYLGLPDKVQVEGTEEPKKEK